MTILVLTGPLGAGKTTAVLRAAIELKERVWKTEIRLMKYCSIDYLNHINNTLDNIDSEAGF